MLEVLVLAVAYQGPDCIANRGHVGCVHFGMKLHSVLVVWL